MAHLTLRNVAKSFGNLAILNGIDLDVPSGELVVFVGPSGCGKSTLLRLIAGLDDITSGTFELNGERMNEVPPSQRGISMVFQSYALYPHMTVYENMAFGMRIAGDSKAEIDRRVREAADILQLSPYLQRVPKALSGGQRQRVAIGRAIVRKPRLFLFDEPLSNLDAALRVATRIEIARLKRMMPETTMVYVTHDQVEAMTLADRIVVLKDGRIEQVGSPMDLYRRPANLFVAQFIGSPEMNILPAVIDTSGAVSALRLAGRQRSVPLPSLPSASSGTPISLGVRPEDLRETSGGDALIEGRVDFVEQLGEVQLVYLQIDTTSEKRMIAKLPGDAEIEQGQVLRLTAEPKRLHLFDESGVSLRNDDLLN